VLSWRWPGRSCPADVEDLSDTAWALATLGHNDAAFMSALLAVARPKLPSFTAADLRQIEFALAKLHIKDVEVARAMAALESTGAARGVRQ
jgi:hypothetical protein